MANARFDIGVSYNLDKQSYTKLMNSLTELDTKAKAAANTGTLDLGLKEAADEAKELKKILDSSWDHKLNQLNLSRLNNEFKQANTTATQFYDKIARGGFEGKQAADAFARSILETNIELTQSNKLLDKMAVTFGNTIRYGISSSVFNQISNSIKSAYEYSKQLDTSLNDIRIVSGKTALEMDKFAASANKAAQTLGKSTLDYTKAATIFYQQGLDTSEVEKRTEIVLKAANVTGQSASEVSEQLTSVWNGYQVGIGELELYVDKLSAVAASSASNLEELSSGMSKVASAANVMGVDIDQLTAQMSTIISVTRQAPESVGTALRTIYARIADIKAGLDDETTLGNYSGKMKKLGFDVLDASGNLKDMGDVIEEIGGKWNTLSKEQQVSLAQVMAGTRQYNNLLTLFDNWDKYTKALQTSQDATGKLQEQQDIYMESTEAHLKQLQTTAEDLYNTLFDQDLVKGFVDTLNLGLKSLTQYVKSLGGGLNSFLGVGSHLIGIFNHKIAEQWSIRQEKKSTLKQNEALIGNQAAIANKVIEEHSLKGEKLGNNAIEQEAVLTEQILKARKNLTQEEFKELNAHKQRIGLIYDETDALKEQKDKLNITLTSQMSYTDVSGKEHNTPVWNMVEQAIKQLGINKAQFDANKQSDLQDLLNGIEEHSSEFEKETQEQINQLLQDRIEYLNQIDNIEDKQNQLALEQKARIQDINEGVKKSNDRGRTQGTVKAIAAGLQATTAMVGMMKVLSSETATAEDRASALFNGILGGAASAISAINPMAGMIAQMGIGLLDTLGISKLFAAALETESEKAVRIAKEANEAYEEQAQRVKDVENSIDNLQSSFNKYEDSLATLDNLTKGTEEWEEAVYNVNQQVLDLMEKFPLLAQYVKEVNGVLTIDKEGYQEVLKQQKLMLAQDRQAAAAAKAGANRASQESLITNYGDTLKKFSADAYKYINSKNLGDAVLSIYRNNADLFTKDTKDIVQALKETLGSTFSDSELNAIANEIKNNSNNLKNLDTSVKSLDESTKILNQQFASGYIDAFGNKILSNSAYKSVLSDAIADIYDSEEYKKWFDENYNENMHNAKVDSTVGQEYVANVRKNWTYKGQDDEGYIKFADENGQEVKLADETVREAVARKIYADTYFNEETLSKRNQELLRLQDELKATLKIDQDTAQELINSMASGKSIDFSLLTNEQIKSFQQWMGTSGGKWGKSLNFGSNVSGLNNWYEQLANSQTSASLMQNALSRGEKYSRNADKMQGILDILSTGKAEDLSDEQVSYLNTLEDKYKELGEIEIQTSTEYLRLLREIKEQEETNSYESLNEAKERQETIITNLYRELEKLRESGATEEIITAKTDEFEEALRKLEEVDHSIQIRIDADLADDVQDAFGLANQFDQLRTKVAQSLELTFEEAQELINNGYGEILTNAHETADATVQLDRDTVNNYIESKQTQLKADKDAKIQQLENQRAVLVAQEQALEQEVSAYSAALEAEDASSAAQALNEAQNAHTVYEAKVDELNNQLKAEADAANQIQDIDDELYTALGGMLETNVKNTEDASIAGANAENINAQQRWKAIRNVYNAWVATGKANAEAANGIVITPYPSFVGATGAAVFGGFSAKSTSGSKTSISSNQITAESLKDYFSEDPTKNQAYKATVEKLRREAESQLNKVRNQIGSVDAGIASLKAADLNLDLYKGGLGSTGKSGSGGSSKDAKSKGPSDDELDRYQLVNVQLKEISKELTKLDKQKDKLLGGDLVKNLNAQIKLLNDQISVTDRKLAIAQDEQDEIAAVLLGYGAKFDSDGNISNYAAMFRQEQAKLDAVYNTYNSMSAEAQENYEDTVKAAEDSWNTFKESITKYDNLIGETIPTLYQDIQDAFDKQTEIFIEEFNMEIKLRLDTSSMLRDWNEFKRKVIDNVKDDDVLGLAKARLANFDSYYNEANNAEIQALTKRIQNQLEEVRKQDAIGSAEWYRDNRAKALEDLKDNYDKIRQSLVDVIKLEEELQQKVLDAMKEAQSEFDKQVKTFDNINKQLDHNIELINLLTDKNDYETLAKQYAAQTKNREQELDFYTKQKDYWENYLKTLEEGSKEWEDAKEKYNAAAEAWSNALKTTIETARKEFENNINLIFQTINNQLTDNKGLEYLNEQWELLSDNSNMVLDNINKMQKFQDLTKKYNDAINSTSNIAAQKKLAQLRDQELAALKGIDNLNEKDLERAEKKLDIVKAQIALEDAQRNKTQMRLRRDSQGNYRYQFVADEEEVQRAQQDLASAYNELYNFDKERYKSNLNDAYAAWNDYQEKMAEAALINDPEVRGEKEVLLTKEYNERILILTEENERIKQELNESTIAELNSLYAQNADSYDLMTEQQKAALSDYEAANQTAFDLIFGLYTQNTEKFRNMTQDQLDIIENQMIPQWTSGYQTLIDKIDGEGGIAEVSTNLANQLHDEAQNYQNDLNDIQIAAGQTFGEITDAQNDIINNTTDMLEANDGLIDKYAEMTDAVIDQYTQLKDLMNEYEQAAKDAKQAAEDAYNYIMREKESEAKAASENVDQGPTTGGTGNYNPGTNSVGPTSNSIPVATNTAPVNSVPSTPFTAIIPKGTSLYRVDGTQYPVGTLQDRSVTVQDTSGNMWRVWGSTFDPHVVYVNRHALGYDTGGYTGDWGNDGRLALLHQKELVLNKEDTANMLNAVEILRGITANIGADILGKLASASAISMNGAIGNNTLDQNVHIEATFPGVTSSIEIQDALNNLVNMASQKVLQR